MIACACSIWHGVAPCGCACHPFDSDELADLAVIGARVRDGGYADDTAAYAPFGVEIPWRVAIEL